MGQDITAIIAKKTVLVPKDIVHFYEDESVVIPLQIGSTGLYYFLYEAKKHTKISDLFTHFLEDANASNFPDYIKDYFKSLSSFIENLRLDDFLIEHYSEWADIPSDVYTIAFIKGEIVNDSIFISEEGGCSSEKWEDYKALVGLNHYFWSNEERYFSYENAYEEYFGTPYVNEDDDPI